jgi:hypothetical protein
MRSRPLGRGGNRIVDVLEHQVETWISWSQPRRLAFRLAETNEVTMQEQDAKGVNGNQLAGWQPRGSTVSGRFQTPAQAISVKSRLRERGLRRPDRHQ